MIMVKSAWSWLVTILKSYVILRTPDHIEFRFDRFIVIVTIQTIGCFWLITWLCSLASPGLLATQLGSPWYKYVICFVVSHAGVGLFEYFFHRYTLHAVFWKPLWPLHRKHEHHHSITPVACTAETVRNQYDITKADQIESSAFPAWSLLAFWAVFSLLILPFQFIFRDYPVIICGYGAVVFSYSLYEILHAIEHLNYEKYWQRWVEKFAFVRSMYGFHMIHHDIKCKRTNLAISGVFGFPLWDIVFGSFYVPKNLPLKGSTSKEVPLTPPTPCLLIQKLDKIVDARSLGIKKKEGKRKLQERN